MEKKISFSAVDNGLLATMEKMRAKSKELAVNLLEDSRSYSKSGEAQVNYLKQLIEQQHKRNRLEQDYQKYAASMQLQGAMKSGNATQIMQAQSAYEQSVKQIDLSNKGEDIMVDLLREQIETLKQISKEEIAEDRKQVERQVKMLEALEMKGEEATIPAADLAKFRIQRDMLKEDEPAPTPDRSGMAVMGGFLGGMVIDKIMQGFSQLPNAQTGLEIINPLAGLTGSIAGGALVGFNPMMAGPAMRMGQAIGEIGGSIYTKHREMQEEFQRGEFQLSALTGQEMTGRIMDRKIFEFYEKDAKDAIMAKLANPALDRNVDSTNKLIKAMPSRDLPEELLQTAVPVSSEAEDTDRGQLFRVDMTKTPDRKTYDLQSLGIDDLEFQKIVQSTIRAGAFSNRAFGEQQAAEAQAASIRFGFQGGDLDNTLRMQRMTGNFNMRDFISMVRGSETMGVSRVGQQDLLKNINSLTESLSNVVERVDPAQAQATLLRFNKLGGAFSVTDPRSMGLINQVQQGVTRSSNDFMQAFQFGAARQAAGPNAGMFDVLRKRQQGINDPEYIANLITNIERMGGGEDYQKMAFAQVMGLEGNLDSVDTLYKGRGALKEGGISAQKVMDEANRLKEDSSQFVSSASAFVAEFDKRKAEITNAYITSGIDAVEAISKHFGEEMRTAVDNIATYFKMQMGIKSPF